MKFLKEKIDNIQKKLKKYNRKKLFIIAGKKSFKKSGAHNLIRFIKFAQIKYYIKKSDIP